LEIATEFVIGIFLGKTDVLEKNIKWCRESGRTYSWLNAKFLSVSILTILGLWLNIHSQCVHWLGVQSRFMSSWLNWVVVAIMMAFLTYLDCHWKAWQNMSWFGVRSNYFMVVSCIGNV
jgi:hypothetical protein